MFRLFVILLSYSLLAAPAFAASAQSGVLDLFFKLLNQQISGQLDAQSVEYRPPGTLSLTRASLRDAQHRRLVAADEVELKVDLSQLLLGKIAIESLSIRKGNISARWQNDTLDILQALSSPKPSPTKGGITIGSLNVTGMKGSIEMLGKSLLLEDLQARARLNATSLSVYDLETRLNHQRTHLSGQIDFATPGALVITTDIKEAHWKTLGPLLDVLPTVEARLEGKFMAKQQHKAMHYTGKLGVYDYSGLDLYLTHPSTLSLDLTQEDSGLKIDDLSLITQGASATMTGYLWRDRPSSLQFFGQAKEPEVTYPKLHLPFQMQDLTAKGQIEFTPNAQATLTAHMEAATFTFLKTSGTHLKAFAELKDNVLSFKQLSGTWSKARIEGNVSVNLKAESLSGAITTKLVDAVELIRNNFDFDASSGQIDAEASLTGSFKNPKIEIALTVKNAFNAWLPVTLAKLNVIYHQDRFVLLPTQIALSTGSLQLSMAHYDTNTDMLTASMQLSSVGVEQIPKLSPILKGSLSGNLTISQTAKSPKIELKGALDDKAQVSATYVGGNATFLELKWDDNRSDMPTALQGQLTITKDSADGFVSFKGSRSSEVNLFVLADARISHRKITGSLCATPTATQTCSEQEGLSGQLSGEIASLSNFTLHLEGPFQIEGSERFFQRFASYFSNLNLGGTLKADVVQTPKSGLRFATALNLNNLSLQFPRLGKVELVRGVEVRYQDGAVQILSPAQFHHLAGDFSIDGFINPERINFNLEGQIPILLLRPFVPTLQNARGALNAHLTFSGHPERPILQGNLGAQKGASFRISGIREEVSWESGQLNFSQSAPGTYRIWADQVRLLSGTATAQLNGQIDVNTDLKKPPFGQVNMSLLATAVPLKSGRDWAECDFDLALDTQDAQNELKGKVTVVDGKLYRQFDFTDFVLKMAQASKESTTSLWQRLPSIQLDVTVDVLSLELDAALIAFEFSGYMRGDIHLKDSIKEPRITGLLGIFDGRLDFTNGRFEVQDASIDFRNTPNKKIDPYLKLEAYAEFSKLQFGLTDDTQIELSLEGNLDQLNLGLKPLSGDTSLDRLQILLLLMGTVPSQGFQITSKFSTREIASSAVSQLLLHPITSGIERFWSAFTGTKFRLASQFGSSGLLARVFWQLDPRIELEGTASLSASAPGLNDARLRVLLFDHLPVGRELYFEGIYQARGTGYDEVSREQLRLTFKILEQ